jgi:hypothetical protein
MPNPIGFGVCFGVGDSAREGRATKRRLNPAASRTRSSLTLGAGSRILL